MQELRTLSICHNPPWSLSVTAVEDLLSLSSASTVTSHSECQEKDATWGLPKTAPVASDHVDKDAENTWKGTQTHPGFLSASPTLAVMETAPRVP